MTDNRSRPAPDAILDALRRRSRLGWDAVSEDVRRRVLSTSRPGRRLRIDEPGTSRAIGDLTVREHALRALLARALRTEGGYEPTRVDLDVDDEQLSGVRVTLRRGLDAELRVVRLRVRRIVLAVIRDVLGDAQHNLLTHTVDIDLPRDDEKAAMEK